MPSEIEKGDIVYLDREANGHNPGGFTLWWLPGQERFKWIVTAVKIRSGSGRKLKHPMALINRSDNGMLPFSKRDKGVPKKPAWIDARWLKKDEFLSAVKRAKTNNHKGEK